MIQCKRLLYGYLTNGGHTPSRDGAVLAIKVVCAVSHLDRGDKGVGEVDLLSQLDHSHVEGEAWEDTPQLMLKVDSNH